MRKKVQVSFSIDSSTKERASKKAHRIDRPLSRVVEDLLEDWSKRPVLKREIPFEERPITRMYSKKHYLLVKKSLERIKERGATDFVTERKLAKRLVTDVLCIVEGKKVAVECETKPSKTKLQKRYKRLMAVVDKVIFVVPIVYDFVTPHNYHVERASKAMKPFENNTYEVWGFQLPKNIR